MSWSPDAAEAGPRQPLLCKTNGILSGPPGAQPGARYAIGEVVLVSNLHNGSTDSRMVKKMQKQKDAVVAQGIGVA